LDGRKSHSEIAKETGLTVELVKKNYEEMEQAGIINGSTIHVNYRSLGYKAVAHILISVDPEQAEKFFEFITTSPGIYAAYSNGPKGNISVVTSLKTLHQLEEIKSTIRQNFSVSEMKTSIWTDVKEMHANLRLTAKTTTSPENRKQIEKQEKIERQDDLSKSRTTIDEIDEKIVDKLSENGRESFAKIAKEIGISIEKAKRRYKKLVNNGIIKVTIQIDPARIGYKAAAIFFVVTSSETSSLINEISQIPDVISIMKSTGDYDLQIWVLLMNIDQLLVTQEKMGRIPSIRKMDIEIVRMPNKWPTPRQYISTI
jgi:Lrp/AsnC family transcriptional regulator for asnA, asnC and gidA